jgi:cell division protein FtsA
MGKKSIFSAIDVGTTKVCTATAEVSNGFIQVTGVGVTPSRGLHKGLVVNISDAKDSIRESIRKAEQASGYRIESAYVGVTGRHVSSENARGVVAISRNDRLVRPDDLRRVLQCAQSVKIPGDRKLLHAIPRGYAVDGQAGVNNPVGMHGFRLDVETHVITAAVTSVQNLIKCIRGVGVDIDDLIFEPLASGEAVLTDDEKQAGVVLADIGGGTTDIAVFKDGSIWHTSVLPVAGYQVTRDLSVGLGLPFDVAEEMKKRFGSVMPVAESTTETAALSEDGHSVSFHDLCDIIRARMEEIIRLVLLELPLSDYKKLVPAGLVFTGGGSNLPGIEALSRETVSLPVRTGIPAGLYGITDALRDPAYATGVGLLLWATRHHGTHFSRSDRFGSRLRRLVSGIIKGVFH